MTQPKSAIILCGGLATRMGGTFPVPKALIPIAKISTLERQIQACKKLQIPESRIILAAGNGPRLQAFQDFVKSKNWQVQVIPEHEQFGTGGALKNAIQKGGAKFPTLVFNGDILLDFDATLPLMTSFENENSDALILGHWLDDASECGLLKEQPDGFITFQEKVPNSKGWINAGIYLLQDSIQNHFPNQTKFSIENDVFPNTKIKMPKHSGWWFNLTNPDVVQEANSLLSKTP